MIQFKRGSSSKWLELQTPLAEGQPGYDKTKHKLKIGDGKTLWKDLPYASGLNADEILASEEDAKKSVKETKNKLKSFLSNLLGIENTGGAIITYGTDIPDENTVGQVYLQYYDTNPEADYVVEHGISGIWAYQLWNSGIAKCSGTYSIDTSLASAIKDEILYSDNKAMSAISYPITFTSVPDETATVRSSGNLVWLAGRKNNSASKSGVYSIITPNKKVDKATYKVTLKVEGFWK